MSAGTSTLALLLGALTAPALAAPGRVLELAHTTDMHGHLRTRPDGGAARFATWLRGRRRQALRERVPFLNVHVGDLFQGTPEVNRSRGTCIPPVLRALGIHFGIPGNHEWDYGPGAFHLLEAAERPRLLSTSIAGLSPRVRPALIYRLPGGPGPALRVGFLGYTTPETPRKAPPGATEGLTFDRGEGLRVQARALRRRGVACLVLLSHTDRDQSEALARDLDLDLVLGGHTNEVIPPRPIPGGRGWYTQAGYHLGSAGWVRLTLDPDTGRARHVMGAVDPLGPLPPDPDLEDAVAPFLAGDDPELERPVAVLEAPIPRGRWSGHNPLAALGAHALREASGADLAVLNALACRVDHLGPGPVTGEQVYTAFPYQNHIQVLLMDGAALDRLYEENVAARFLPFASGAPGRYLDDPRGILQPSGFVVHLDPDRPAGSRVRLLQPDGRPLAQDREFRVATSSYLADGGDGFGMLAAAARDQALGSVREAVQARLERLGDGAPRGPGGLVNTSHEGP